MENLRAAWDASKDASRQRRSAGIDGVSPERFRSRLDENLRKARLRLLEQDFSFNDLKPVFVPKKNGKDRVICVPTVEDRLIQRLFLQYLVQKDLLKITNNVSYGFRKGYGVQAAVKKAKSIRQHHPWVFKSDITSFFDQIDRKILKATVAHRLGKSSAVPFLCAAMDCEIECANADEKKRISNAGIRTGLGLRQGMPLSPFLSNVVLRDFDKAFEKKGIPLVRYADDFIVFGDSEADCARAYELASEVLALKNHKIPEPEEGNPQAKTLIVGPQVSVEFLGFEIQKRNSGYQIVVPASAFETAHDMAVSFSDFSVLNKQYKNFSAALQSMNAKMAGFLNVYKHAHNYSDLRSHAENCRRTAVDKLLHSLFGKQAIDALTPDKKLFLDLLYDDEGI